MKTFTITSEIEKKYESKKDLFSFDTFVQIESEMFYKREISKVLSVETKNTYTGSRNFASGIKSTYSVITSEQKKFMNEVYSVLKNTFASKIIIESAKNQNGIFTEKQIDIIVNELYKSFLLK